MTSHNANYAMKARVAGMTLITLMLIGAALVPARSSLADDKAVTDSMLQEFEADHSRFRLFDARTAEEYAEAHIDGAVNLPVKAFDNNRKLLPDDHNATIVVYCKTGARAGLLKSYIDDLGYTDVRILRPAQIRWSEGKGEFEHANEAAEALRPADQ